MSQSQRVSARLATSSKSPTISPKLTFPRDATSCCVKFLKLQLEQDALQLSRCSLRKLTVS